VGSSPRLVGRPYRRSAACGSAGSAATYGAWLQTSGVTGYGGPAAALRHVIMSTVLRLERHLNSLPSRSLHRIILGEIHYRRYGKGYSENQMHMHKDDVASSPQTQVILKCICRLDIPSLGETLHFDTAGIGGSQGRWRMRTLY
jgi:hypothetical protein